VAVMVGLYGVDHPKRAIAISGAVVAGVVLVNWGSKGETWARRLRWLPLAWVALLLIPDLRLGNTDPLAVVEGRVGLHHVIQVAAYAGMMALLIHARAAVLYLYRWPVPKGLILAWPALAAISALWSVTPLYTLIRSLQLVVLASIALLFVRIWLSDRAAGEELWIQALRLFIHVVTALAIIGLVTGTTHSGRFTWPGMHPGVAATYLGCAVLIMIAGGRSILRFQLWSYWARLLFFVVTTILAQTRSVLAGLVAATAAILWLRGRERPEARYLGLPYLFIGALVLSILAVSELAAYLSRGESTASVTSLSGRIPLWEFAFSLVDSVREFFLGFGYGAAKTLLYPEIPWAGTAHSTWIELLLGIGVIGIILFAADLLLVGIWLVRSRVYQSINRIAFALLLFLLVLSPISEFLVMPGAGFGILALLHVPALALRGRQREPAGRADRLRAPPPL
jgi:hypothetical protein